MTRVVLPIFSQTSPRWGTIEVMPQSSDVMRTDSGFYNGLGSYNGQSNLCDGHGHWYFLPPGF